MRTEWSLNKSHFQVVDEALPDMRLVLYFTSSWPISVLPILEATTKLLIAELAK
jgi:hypothetical protein